MTGWSSNFGFGFGFYDTWLTEGNNVALCIFGKSLAFLMANVTSGFQLRCVISVSLNPAVVFGLPGLRKELNK